MNDEIAGLFANVASRGYDDDVEAKNDHMITMSGLGQRLFRELIPPELAEEIRKWADGTCVQLSTEERWIPWELLHDGRNFLGGRFLLFRLPRVLDDEGDEPVPVDDTGPSGPLRIVHVIGGGLGGGYAATRQLLFDDLVPPPERLYECSTLVDCSTSVVLKAVADATLVHFDCHGHRDSPPRLQMTSKTDKYRQLTLDIVQSNKLSLRAGCLVFANACESNAPAFGLSEVRSFGWAFYAKGAGAFIGTLGTVPAKAAFAFADRFYRELAGRAYGEVGRAYWLSIADPDTPARLMYCIYGNPNVLRRFFLRSP